jgi:hypothetical protein
MNRHSKILTIIFFALLATGALLIADEMLTVNDIVFSDELLPLTLPDYPDEPAVPEEAGFIISEQNEALSPYLFLLPELPSGDQPSALY